MRILVLGGAGFIGSNFILNQINEYGNTIHNYDKLTYAGNNNNLLSIKDHPNYSFSRGDINNRKKVKKVLEEFMPDGIVNFAADSHVDRSIDGPREFIDTNINGTYELLCNTLDYYKTLDKDKKSLFRLLHISTDEVYGSLGNSGKFSENTPYNPSSPYSASKASSDHLVNAWFKTYGLPILITNCSNNYGPYQFPEKLIPLMIMNCLNHEPLPIYGKGDNVRDWIYVDDHCRGVYKVLREGKIGNSYNIGGNQEYTNLQIVNSICDILDKLHPSDEIDSYSSLITFVKDRPGHDFRYAIDSTKIEKELNFYPKVNLKDGLENTINWYLDNLEWVSDINNKNYKQERLGLNS